MFWLIETQDQIEYLINKKYKEAFIEIIPYHDKIHPAFNGVSLVYFRPSIDFETTSFPIQQAYDHRRTL